MGTANVVEAALDAGVKKVLMVSTDKAVSPANLYGATKLAAEKLTIQSNAYAGGSATRFSCVRYGNVVGAWLHRPIIPKPARGGKSPSQMTA
jgi:UDP-N-acetylglucosamine 4,6-dehydratase